MPYFKTLNILYIHIPKTGGSNIENYFFNKSKTYPTINNLLSYNIRPINLKINDHSLQHLTYKEILQFKKFLNIDLDKSRMFTVVRNPYDRIISDLFFFRLIDKESTQDKVEKEIKKYLDSDSNYDNHKILQYNFILDENDKVDKNIIVIKTETLNKEMKNLGFPDFSEYCSSNFISNKDYSSYMNNGSIKIINSYYKKDFEYFNYKQL